jgi:hypothetical protein
VDIDQVLHPAAARFATAAAASAARVGDTATAGGATLATRFGSLAGRDERVDTPLHTALWALALTMALALLAAALA